MSEDAERAIEDRVEGERSCGIEDDAEPFGLSEGFDFRAIRRDEDALEGGGLYSCARDAEEAAFSEEAAFFRAERRGETALGAAEGFCRDERGGLHDASAS